MPVDEVRCRRLHKTLNVLLQFPQVLLGLFAQYGERMEEQKQKTGQEQKDRREEKEAYERALAAKDQEIDIFNKVSDIASSHRFITSHPS